MRPGVGLLPVQHCGRKSRRSAAKLHTKNEAQRIAANIAKLPELLWKLIPRG
jgi:hypothetical protein